MYEYKSLLELSTLITRGISPKYSEKGYAVINQRCIRDNRIDLDTARITKLKTRINPEKFVKKYDVLVNSTGVGTLGRVAQVKDVFRDTTVDSHVTITRPNLKLVDGLYFGYGVIFRESYIESLGTGATGQTELSRHRLGDVEIPLPLLLTQRKIASILSAYDDLVENNTRRIQILEEMAQLIYREWFVHYRFPGHEHVKMVDSGIEFGEIPDGWEIYSIDELISFHIGGGWGKEEPNEVENEPAWVIRGTDIPNAKYCDASKVPLRYHKGSLLKSRLLEKGDIVFEVAGGSKDQPLGRCLFVTNELLKTFNGDPIINASFCKRINPRNKLLKREILYHSFVEAYTNGEIEKFQVQSTGIINFHWSEYITRTCRVVPPEHIQEKYLEIVSPIITLIGVLGTINNNLRKTRSLLLPKLISGEIDVSDLDIELA